MGKIYGSLYRYSMSFLILNRYYINSLSNRFQPKFTFIGNGISQTTTKLYSTQLFANNYHKLPRVYIDSGLNANDSLLISEDLSHYLLHVMRLKNGHNIRAFDGFSGEYICKVEIEQRKKLNGVRLLIESRIRSFEGEQGVPITLYFAPIKKPKLKLMFEKVTELGITNLVPIYTQNTNIQYDENEWTSLTKILIESSEQSERLSIPKLHPPQSFQHFIHSYNNSMSTSKRDSGANAGHPINPKDSHSISCSDQELWVCTERSPESSSLLSALLDICIHTPSQPILPTPLPIKNTSPLENTSPVGEYDTKKEQIQSKSRLLKRTIQQTNDGMKPSIGRTTSSTSIDICTQKNSFPILPSVLPSGILVGPEGGFTAEELSQITSCHRMRKVSLGQNVLRAETASIVVVSTLASVLDVYRDKTLLSKKLIK